MRKKKKELSREEEDRMVKDAMRKEACKGNVSAAKTYLEMRKMEKEEKGRKLTPKEREAYVENKMRQILGLDKEAEKTYTRKHKGRKQDNKE